MEEVGKEREGREWKEMEEKGRMGKDKEGTEGRGREGKGSEVMARLEPTCDQLASKTEIRLWKVHVMWASMQSRCCMEKSAKRELRNANWSSKGGAKREPTCDQICSKGGPRM